MKQKILHVALLQCVLACVLGCQPQMCRKKRAVQENQGRVRLLNLRGCSIQSPQWTRQIAYCLNLVETTMVFRTRDWYQEVYPICEARGCSVRNGAKEVENIDQCVRCWKEKISIDKVAANFPDITASKIETCVNDYIYAFLNQSQPMLSVLSRHKYEIDIPETRPANYWWSVTVDLPCKPKNFVFFNAYCINSFGTDLTKGDYVLVQNNLVRTDSGMTFFVEYSEDCTFEAKDIKIIWSESSPTPGLPQMESLSSSFLRSKSTPMKIYYDIEAAERLTYVGGGFVEEYDTALRKDQGKRVKRQINDRLVNSRLSKLGLAFPCTIGSLGILPKGRSSQTNSPYKIVGSQGNKYLLDITGLKSKRQTTKFEFNLNFGNSGCYFDAADVLILPNPPLDWLSEPKKGLVCVTCHNAKSDEDCAERGINNVCMDDEICQTEIRHITKRQKLISKSCKAKNVCTINAKLKKNSGQCRPGTPGSACVCCCNSDLCNINGNDC